MDFVRVITQAGGSLPIFPPGLDSFGLSGKGQFRNVLQVGREWMEIYQTTKWDNPNLQKFVAYINKLWSERTIFTIAHADLSILLGDAPATDTPLLKGASQSGSTITTDGWSNNTTVLRAGDVIKIQGINIVYDITEDATSNGSGESTLTISPPLYPPSNFLSDNKAITFNSTDGNVKFRAVIKDRPVLPECAADRFYFGISISFREVP